MRRMCSCTVCFLTYHYAATKVHISLQTYNSGKPPFFLRQIGGDMSHVAIISIAT